jgi:hypothetical protein
MRHLDGELQTLVRNGVVAFETAMMHATDPQRLRQILQK